MTYEHAEVVADRRCRPPKLLAASQGGLKGTLMGYIRLFGRDITIRGCPCMCWHGLLYLGVVPCCTAASVSCQLCAGWWGRTCRDGTRRWPCSCVACVCRAQSHHLGCSVGTGIGTLMHVALAADSLRLCPDASHTGDCACYGMGVACGGVSAVTLIGMSVAVVAGFPGS